MTKYQPDEEDISKIGKKQMKQQLTKKGNKIFELGIQEGKLQTLAEVLEVIDKEIGVLEERLKEDLSFIQEHLIKQLKAKLQEKTK